MASPELEVIQSSPGSGQSYLERLKVAADEGCLDAALKWIELGQVDLKVDSVSSLSMFEKNGRLPVHSGSTRILSCIACEATATIVYGDYRLQDFQDPQLGSSINDACSNELASLDY